MTEPAHSQFSPSKFERLIPCPGSFAMEQGLPDDTSEYADEGTAAHQLASWTLQHPAQDAFAFQGRVMHIVNGQYWAGGAKPPMLKGRDEHIERLFEADVGMCGFVQTYVDNVLKMSKGGDLLVEQRVSISDAIGYPKQKGTSDTIVLRMRQRELQVHDLKYGMGVQVFAERNSQMMLYACGALWEYGLINDFDTVLMVIHQPRLDHLDKWRCSVADLREFADTVAKPTVRNVLEADEQYLILPEKQFRVLYTRAGKKHCKFCKAKKTCPSYKFFVDSLVAGEDECEDLAA